MAILPYDLNAYIQAKAELLALIATWGQTSISIVPLNESEPCAAGSVDGFPFLAYAWMPSVMSNNMYFLREDRVRYYVRGRDFDQCMQIYNMLIRIFDTNVFPTPKIPCSTGENSIKNTYATKNSYNVGPRTIGGLAEFVFEIDVLYTSQLLAP